MALSVHPRVAAGIVAAALVALVSPPETALACSICRCGDPTFNALGKAGFNARGFRLAFDWERFDKDEGNPAEESESQVENRFTGLVSYGFSERFMLNARVPVSVRNLEMSMPEEETETVHTSGLSDPEIYGQLRLWASPLTGPLGRRASLSLVAGLKTPWGENDVREDGERVDEQSRARAPRTSSAAWRSSISSTGSRPSSPPPATEAPGRTTSATGTGAASRPTWPTSTSSGAGSTESWS